MSRFWAESSSSESGSESDSSTDQQRAQARAAKAATKFELDSSSSEDEGRTVLSAKAKKWGAMQTTIKAMRNHMKIGDWAAARGDWDTLLKQLDKAKAVVRQEGGVPAFIWKAFVTLEQGSGTAFAQSKAARKEKNKKFNAETYKNVSVLHQRLRKYRQANKKAIEAYEKNPLDTDDEEEEEMQARSKRMRRRRRSSSSSDSSSSSSSSSSGSGSGSDSGSDSDAAMRRRFQKKQASSSSEEESAEESDDSDVDLDAGGITRDFWVKKAPTKVVKTSKRDRKARADRRMAKKEAAKAAKAGKVEEIKAEVVFTPEMVKRKLRELMAMMGRRGTNRVALVADLKLLATKASDPAALLKVQATLASALFDLGLNKGDYMPVRAWKEAVSCMEAIIKQLSSDKSVRLSEDDNVEETLDLDDGDETRAAIDAELKAAEGDEQTEEEQKAAEEQKIKEMAAKEDAADKRAAEQGVDGVTFVAGNLYSFLARLHLEFRRSLQHIDPYHTDYVQRLQDERTLVALLRSAREYYSSVEKTAMGAKCAALELEHVYYLYRPELDAQREQPDGAEEHPEKLTVERLAHFLYKSGEPAVRTSALLYHVYHLAVHNRVAEARNLMLMSHVQDTISGADIRTRALYNRTLAQIGIASFRTGASRNALDCLADLYQTNRVKELLAQGTSQQRWGERDLEKERLEKQRQEPYHLHMNLDMLEGVMLVSAMFVELVPMAAPGYTRRYVVSKYFRRLFDNQQRQAFNGPPESTRELVMASSRALMQGDWQKCQEYVFRLRMWNLFPNADKVKELVSLKIREVSLKIYLLAYGNQYLSLSHESLCKMFELDSKLVAKLVSKMIVDDQLQGAWDQPTNMIVMHSQEPTRLQKAALVYSDKLEAMVEENEKLIDARGGRGGGGRGGRRGGRGGRRGGGRGRGRGGRGRGGRSRNRYD